MPGGIFLLLGTNLGDRIQNLNEATGRMGPALRSSSIYETAAWGKISQPNFLNKVIEIDTSLSPGQLLQHALDTEISMGRVRAAKWGPRVIDIDILFYDNQIINTPDLTIPHPEIQNRRFTLVPLAELTNMIHPVLKKTIGQLLEDCKDPLEVTRL